MLATPVVSSTASATSDSFNSSDSFSLLEPAEVQSITVAEGFDNAVVREGFEIEKPVVVVKPVVPATPAAAATSSAPAAGSPDPGSAQAIALAMLNERGLGADEYSCLVSLWQRESNWNVYAYNASSGAYGIPQSLPGNKMASAGADWETNPVTQISWGLGYISGRYGTPCGAWAHSESNGWY